MPNSCSFLFLICVPAIEVAAAHMARRYALTLVTPTYDRNRSDFAPFDLRKRDAFDSTATIFGVVYSPFAVYANASVLPKAHGCLSF